MPDSAPEPKIANMQHLMNQIAGSRPNTHIKGSAAGAAASEKPEKAEASHAGSHGRRGD